MVKVSVIIPAYNIERYIEKCLKSISDQTLKEIEIIVINDGSTDNTVRIIKEHIRWDNRIRVISTKNNGVSAARNQGLMEAKGKYIYQIDGDDWLEPSGLEELYRLGEHQKADIVIANAYQNNKGDLKQILDGDSLSDDLINDLFSRRIKPSVCTKLYRKELFEKKSIKYSDQIRIGEDLLINFYLFFYAKKVVKINKSFLYYIKRQDSAINSYKEEINDIFLVFEEIKTFLIRVNLYKKHELMFVYLKYYHTYYMRVVLSNKFGPIHKELYENYKVNKLSFEQNPYIIKHRRNNRYVNRIAESLYNRNYYLGLWTRNIMLKVSQTKKINEYLLETKKVKGI